MFAESPLPGASSKRDPFPELTMSGVGIPPNNKEFRKCLPHREHEDHVKRATTIKRADQHEAKKVESSIRVGQLQKQCGFLHIPSCIPRTHCVGCDLSHEKARLRLGV